MNPLAQARNRRRHLVGHAPETRSGSRIRGRFRIVAVEDVPGGEQLRVDVTIEREGEEKPACVAEALFRFYTSFNT